MNPMEKRRLAGYIFIFIAIGIFAGSMLLSFFFYYNTLHMGFTSEILVKISRTILFVGLVMALISLCIGLFLSIKYRNK
ncbi:MAG: hypothetical protein ACFFDF_20355 [Candidatus Odinarchaeota archaeon]